MYHKILCKRTISKVINVCSDVTGGIDSVEPVDTVRGSCPNKLWLLSCDELQELPPLKSATCSVWMLASCNSRLSSR